MMVEPVHRDGIPPDAPEDVRAPRPKTMRCRRRPRTRRSRRCDAVPGGTSTSSSSMSGHSAMISHPADLAADPQPPPLPSTPPTVVQQRTCRSGAVFAANCWWTFRRSELTWASVACDYRPMPIGITEDHEHLRTAVRRFVDDRISPAVLREALEAKAEARPGVLGRAARARLDRPPRRRGARGSGAGLVEQAVVVEELGPRVRARPVRPDRDRRRRCCGPTAARPRRRVAARASRSASSPARSRSTARRSSRAEPPPT